MPPVIPFVPQKITVHLGAPSQSAENITVSFSDYIKNVTCSEIYPTWETSALRANILAITSFALNRIYTEFYRSRGYDFDITSSTAFDQAFVKGRSYFENISRLVDSLFNDYLRRPGFVEPLAAKFCNGTTVTCDGLSQWGSQNLAQQGYNSNQILRRYYGNVETVLNAPIRGYSGSYPGRPLRKGSSGPNVVVIQVSLNRISQNYPAIPKLSSTDGIFGERTEASVRSFQEIFDLDVDGIVGPGTWYEIVRLYTAVTRLSELHSLGQQFYSVNWSAPNALRIGSTGDKVRLLQYMLAMISEYIPEIPPTRVDGIYGAMTRSAVLSAQRYFQIPETGSVDSETWNEIYSQYSGIENLYSRGVNYAQINRSSEVEAFSTNRENGHPTYYKRSKQDKGRALDNRQYAETSSITQFPGYNLEIGMQDRTRLEGL